MAKKESEQQPITQEDFDHILTKVVTTPVLRQKSQKQRILVPTVVKTVDLGIDVPLHILGGDGIVGTVDAPFDVAPNPFDAVDVGGPSDVVLGGMVNGLMGITKDQPLVISAERSQR